MPSLLAKRTEKSRERNKDQAGGQKQRTGESKRTAAEKGEVVDETTARTSSALRQTVLTEPDRVHLRFDRLG